LVHELERRGISVTCFQITGEPTLSGVQDGIDAARQSQSDLVIGIGGGSVIDSGKVLAAMLTNQRPLLDYLEVIGAGRPLKAAGAPYIAIPTTAGTGAEVTRNSVLASPEHGIKVSMRSRFMLPSIAVVDPELTHSMPPQLTACTGLDALTQLLEAYVSKKSNPFTDALCTTGLKHAAVSLARAFHAGGDARAREGMALASLFSGLALANAGLGAVHGLAGPMGGMFAAAHGNLCAALLPSVMSVNVTALEARLPTSPALKRYREVASILTGQAEARIEEGVAWVSDLCQQLNVPGLSSYGVTTKDFPAIVEKSLFASSMRGNPVELTKKEVVRVLELSMGC